MPGVNPVEIWMIDFGMAAKVRPALLLTGEPTADELDLRWSLCHDRQRYRAAGLETPLKLSDFAR